MTTLADLEKFPVGTPVEDLSGSVTAAYEYKEFQGRDGATFGYLPFYISDGSTEKGWRVHWKKPSTTDFEALKGQHVRIMAYEGKGAKIGEFKGQRRIEVTGKCVHLGGPQYDGPQPAPQTQAPQAAPAPAGKRTFEEAEKIQDVILERALNRVQRLRTHPALKEHMISGDSILNAVVNLAAPLNMGVAKGDHLPPEIPLAEGDDIPY